MRLIPSGLAPVETDSSLVAKRVRTKFTLVVRSDNFFFFEPVNLHGKLTDLFGIFSFFLAFFGKFFPEIIFSLIIESKRSISKEFFLPVTKEIWLNIVFNSKNIESLLALKQLEDKIGFRTDYQITSQKNMRKILNQTKKMASYSRRTCGR